MRAIPSDRLVLRPWEPEDSDFLLDLEGRWEVLRYLGTDRKTVTSRADALASIQRRRAIGEHPIHGIWLITHMDGTRLGNLLLKPIPLSEGEKPADPVDVEIGWHLHPDAGGTDTRPKQPARRLSMPSHAGRSASSRSPTPTITPRKPCVAVLACSPAVRPSATWTRPASSLRSQATRADMPHSARPGTSVKHLLTHDSQAPTETGQGSESGVAGLPSGRSRARLKRANPGPATPSVLRW